MRLKKLKISEAPEERPIINEDKTYAKPAKKGRKPKESDKILPEDNENLDNGVTTPAEVAEKRGIKRSTVDNSQRRRREKLSIRMDMKKADTTLPDVKASDSQSNNFENPDEQSPTGVGGVPDATEALKGMYSFLDTMLVMTSTLTKGRVEYTKLEEEELNRLAVTSNQSPHLRNFAINENLSGIVIAGTIIGTFGAHLKFNMVKRHDEKKALENKCECEKCEEARKNAPTQDEIQTIIDSVKVNDVPVIPTAKTPEEVIAQNTKPKVNADVDFNEALPKTVLDDQFEATPEYILPTDNEGKPL